MIMDRYSCNVLLLLLLLSNTPTYAHVDVVR